jgi:PST family polysaccharide transporter
MNEKLSLVWQYTGPALKTALHSSVAKNAASLYIIQFANYILPLITVPYLVRVLGPAGFGVVAFGQSLTGYFALFVDYGFGLSATRKISVERDDPVAVSQTVSSVWAAKTLLCVAGFAVLLFLVTVVPKLHHVALLLLILYGTVVGSVFFPVWLFQGKEKMAAISVINLAMRLLVVTGIFTMIHRPGDYLLYAGLISLGALGAGLAGAGAAFYMFKLPVVIPSWQRIWEALVEGWTLFLSQASISLYTVGNAFILGLLTNDVVVGYYSAAEKLVKAVLGVLGPITQAAYPKFSKMASESRVLALQWARRMLIVMSSFGLLLSLALFVGAPLIVRIVLGEEYEPSIMVMYLLAALPFLIAASNVLGIQLMIPFGKDKAFTLILFAAGLVNICLAIPLAPLWRESGMAVAVLLSETFVTGTMLIYLSVRQLNPLWGIHGAAKAAASLAREKQ